MGNWGSQNWSNQTQSTCMVRKQKSWVYTQTHSASQFFPIPWDCICCCQQQPYQQKPLGPRRGVTVRGINLLMGSNILGLATEVLCHSKELSGRHSGMCKLPRIMQSREFRYCRKALSIKSSCAPVQLYNLSSTRAGGGRHWMLSIPANRRPTVSYQNLSLE